MNRALFGRTLVANRVRLAACALGVVVWGTILPVIYATFGREIGSFISGNPLFEQFSRFGDGDLFSLHGSIALGFIHPFMLLLMGIMAIGFPAIAIAGERQRGTLEVLLARPVSRRTVYLTVLVAGGLFLAILLALFLAAASIAATVMGVGADLALDRLPLVFLNGWLLFFAILCVAFAASVSFDRLPPALGVPLALVLVSYLIDALGTLWPDAAWIRTWSVFHLAKPQKILDGAVPAGDLAILAAIAVLAIGYAWVIFPRRDLAAPS